MLQAFQGFQVQVFQVLKVVLAAGIALAAAGAASAHAQSPLPANTIDCSAFVKTASGAWHVGASTTFELAGNSFTFGDRDITPHSTTVNGIDLYDVLESKCGKHG